MGKKSYQKQTSMSFRLSESEAHTIRSLLREDKLAASALLEYSDLLLLENTKGNKEKVYELIQMETIIVT